MKDNTILTDEIKKITDDFMALETKERRYLSFSEIAKFYEPRIEQLLAKKMEERDRKIAKLRSKLNNFVRGDMERQKREGLI